MYNVVYVRASQNLPQNQVHSYQVNIHT